MFFALSRALAAFILVTLGAMLTISLERFREPRDIFLVTFRVIRIGTLVTFRTMLVVLFVVLGTPFIAILVVSRTPSAASLVGLRTPSTVSFVPYRTDSRSPIGAPAEGSVVPLDMSTASPVVLVGSSGAFVTIIPAASVVFTAAKDGFTVVRLVGNAGASSREDFERSVDFPEGTSVFGVTSPGNPSGDPLGYSTDPYDAKEACILCPIVEIPGVLSDPFTVRSGGNFAYSSCGLSVTSLEF